jgi:hypothetical protein
VPGSACVERLDLAFSIANLLHELQNGVAGDRRHTLVCAITLERLDRLNGSRTVGGTLASTPAETRSATSSQTAA